MAEIVDWINDKSFLHCVIGFLLIIIVILIALNMKKSNMLANSIKQYKKDPNDPNDPIEQMSSGSELEKNVQMEKNAKDKLVLFYSNSCGYCTQFMPVWMQCKEELKANKNLEVFEIECSNGGNGCANVRGYPTVIMYVNGSPVEFQGERTVDAVLAFVHKNQ
jgi:thioredoxin-like negative regulator of GroEL